LCNNKKYYPKLRVNLNISHLNLIEQTCNNYLNFASDHVNLQSRKEFIAEKKIKNDESLFKMQNDANDRFLKYQKENEEQKRVLKEKKKQNLDILKEQIESNLKRREEEKLKIKQEDQNYIENIVNRNSDMTKRQNFLEQEVKQEILQEYEILNKKAEERESAAKSKIEELSKILMLQQKDALSNNSTIVGAKTEMGKKEGENSVQNQKKDQPVKLEIDITENERNLNLNNSNSNVTTNSYQKIESTEETKEVKSNEMLKLASKDMPEQSIVKKAVMPAIKLTLDTVTLKNNPRASDEILIDRDEKTNLDNNNQNNLSFNSQNREAMKENKSVFNKKNKEATESFLNNFNHHVQLNSLKDNKNSKKSLKVKNNSKFILDDQEIEIYKDQKLRNERFIFFSQKDNRVESINFDDIIKPYKTNINFVFDLPIGSSLMSLELIHRVNHNISLVDDFLANSNYLYKKTNNFFSDPNEKDYSIETEQSNGLLIQGDVYSFNYIEIDDILNRILFKPIQIQSELVNKCLINYFLFDLNLEGHLEAIRKYFLFENGEFAQVLIDQLSENLFSIDYVSDKNLKNEVNRTKFQLKNLLSPIYVYEALNKAVSQIKNCKFIDKLSIFINNERILNSNDQSRKNEEILTFLNCLELKYTVGFPLNLIINQKSIASYNKLFTFLLQIKFVMHSNKNIWFTLKKIGKY
jgi:hypothetical protein